MAEVIAETGKCMCAPGYCKGHKKGVCSLVWSLDVNNNEVQCTKHGKKICRELECWRGAAVPLPEADTFDSAFAGFAFGAPALDFPTTRTNLSSTEFNGAWDGFVHAALFVPIVVVVIGVLTSLCACCFIGAPPRDSSDRLCLPVPCWIIILALLMLLLMGIAIALRHKYEAAAQQQMIALVDDGVIGYQKVDVLLSKLANFSDSLFNQFIAMEKTCLWPMDDAVKEYVKKQGSNINDLNSSLTHMVDLLAPHKGMLNQANQDAAHFNFWLFQVPMIPMYLIFILSVLCILLVLLTCCFRGDCVPERCVNCMSQQILTSCAGCNMFCVFYAAFTFFYAVMLSGFCQHPDGNILNFVYMGGGSYATRPSDADFVNYYLVDQMPNPVLLTLNDAKRIMTEVDHVYHELQWLLDPVQWVCSSLHIKKDIGAVLGEPLSVINQLIMMFHAQSVYPAYVETRTMMCRDTPGSVGIAAFFTLIIVVLIMPCILCLTAMHLGDWFETHEKKDLLKSRGIYGDDPDGEEDVDSGVDLPPHGMYDEISDSEDDEDSGAYPGTYKYVG